MDEHVCPDCSTEWPSEAAAEGWEVVEDANQCETCGGHD